MMGRTFLPPPLELRRSSSEESSDEESSRLRLSLSFPIFSTASARQKNQLPAAAHGRSSRAAGTRKEQRGTPRNFLLLPSTGEASTRRMKVADHSKTALFLVNFFFTA